MKLLGLLLPCLLLSPLVGPDESDKIKKLAAECEARKAKACGKLAEIAKGDSDEHVRKAALEKLTDQTMLTDIARNDRDESVRAVAVDKLTDQATLADIAKNDEHGWVRAAAVSRLTRKGVESGRNGAPRRRAGVSDAELAEIQALLAEVAKTDAARFVREFAAECSRAIAAAQTGYTRRPVVSGVYEGKCSRCGKLVTGGPSYCPYCGAGFSNSYRESQILEMVTTDQAVLAALAKNDMASDVRAAAVAKLTDEGLLADVAENSQDENIRKAAVEKLTDRALLVTIAKNHRSSGVRQAAEKRLKELAEE